MAKPSLPALVDEWLDEKQTLGRGLSKASEAAYRSDLTGWAWRIAQLLNRPPAEGPPARVRSESRSGLGGDGDRDGGRRSAGAGPAELGRITLADLNPDNTKRALASLAREGYAPASRARMLAALRGFCGWLVRNDYLKADPTTGFENPAPAERLPVAFLGSELRAILEVVSTVDPRARNPWPLRDRALVAVLAGAGLRASELVSLHVAHVLRDREVVLRVIGKGNKERRVPVATEVVAAIDAYLDERSHRLGRIEAATPLFVRENAKGFTREALNYHVAQWLKRAGVHKPEGEVAHAFRHTYAKGLVANGVEINAVQRLLGHANLGTTSVYLRMTAVELHAAAQAAEINVLLREVPAPTETAGGTVDA